MSAVVCLLDAPSPRVSVEAMWRLLKTKCLLLQRRRAQIQELLVHLDGVIASFEAEDCNGGGEADANGSAAPMAVE